MELIIKGPPSQGFSHHFPYDIVKKTLPKRSHSRMPFDVRELSLNPPTNGPFFPLLGHGSKKRGNSNFGGINKNAANLWKFSRDLEANEVWGLVSYDQLPTTWRFVGASALPYFLAEISERWTLIWLKNVGFFKKLMLRYFSAASNWKNQKHIIFCLTKQTFAGCEFPNSTTSYMRM